MQALCGNETGLLFVTGVDGKFNYGSAKALNYIFGKSGREIYQRIKDDLEDVRIIGTSNAYFDYEINV